MIPQIGSFLVVLQKLSYGTVGGRCAMQAPGSSTDSPVTMGLETKMGIRKEGGWCGDMRNGMSITSGVLDSKSGLMGGPSPANALRS